MRQLTSLLLFLFCFSEVMSQELIIPIGHTRRVVDFCISADGQFMASIDGSSEVKIWNYQTGRETYHFSNEQTPYTAIAYHPKTTQLVSASRAGGVDYWNAKGKLLWSARAAETEITGTHFSKTGDSLYIVTPEEVILLLAANGQELVRWTDGLSGIESTYFDAESDLLFLGNKSGELVAMSTKDGKINFKMTISESRIGTLATFGEDIVLGTDGGELIRVSGSGEILQVQTPFTLRNYEVLLSPSARHLYACGRDETSNFKTFELSNLKEVNSPITFDIDKTSEAYKFGLRAMTATDSTVLIADHDQTIREFHVGKNSWLNRTFSGKASPIYDLSVNSRESQLVIASGHAALKVIDLTGTGSDIILNSGSPGYRAVDFHPVNPVIAAFGQDEVIRVVNLMSEETIFELRAKGDYLNTPVDFDPTGRYILRKSSEKDFDFYNFRNKSPRNLKVKDGRRYAFTPDGRTLIFLISDGFSVYDPITFTELKEITVANIQDFSISGTGQIATLINDDQTVHLFNKDFKMVKTFSLSTEALSDRIYWTPDEKYLVGLRNSIKRGESGADFSLKIINPQDGSLVNEIDAHDGFTNSIAFVKDKMITGSIDGAIKIWDLNVTGEPLVGSVIPLQNDQYVVTTPSGLFDATAQAMGQLHYVKDGELIALDQMKSTYYEPKLLSKIIGWNEESVRPVNDLSTVSLYPELELAHPLKNGGKLGINLSDNGGGIGQVIILINGKEVSSDVRGIGSSQSSDHLEINYNISEHPFLYSDRVNKVTIKAFNNDGTLSTDEKSLYIFGEEKLINPPRLFAVIAGSSDYEGESLDLKYAAKDATDLANALQLSASKYLGAGNIDITLLTTDKPKSQWPTKENIRQAFMNYSKKATANDILLVYLSGHGVNQSGEQSDFYYLTCSASNGDMNNTVLRENAAISSVEFTEYIKSVPALKQILIIDACHSGRLASSLASSRSAMSSTQIRALERMKDRTGLFVLAGSAADAVSYETTLYGQGLLTYSLLFGMKGAALRENEFIDVLQLFQFAANKVPELAEEIGGIQKPEVRVPEEGKSFDIGRLEPADKEKITIAAPKAVFVQSRFQDETVIYDRLKVSELLDTKMLELSKEKDAPFVFVDDKNFSGAISISGRYTEDNGLIKARVTLVIQNEVMNTLDLEAVNANNLTDALVEIIRKTSATDK